MVPLPHHEAAWQLALVDPLEATDGAAVVLHDRSTPDDGTIDHIAVSPTGIYVVDAHSHTGKVRVEKPWLGPPRLKIAGRNCTSLIDVLDSHVTAVRAALPGLSELREPTPVTGVLFFHCAELPVFGTVTMRHHLLLNRKALVKRLNKPGPVPAERLRDLAHHLAAVLPAG